MRCFVAKCLAAVTGLAILVLALLFGFLQNVGSVTTPTSAPSPEADSARPDLAEAPDLPETRDPAEARDLAAILARGREVYGREGCGACHSIGGEGNRRSPLDGVGSRLDREAIRRWIVEPKAMNPRVRKPAYDALSEEDLMALTAYLANLGE